MSLLSSESLLCDGIIAGVAVFFAVVVVVGVEIVYVGLLLVDN